MIHSKRSKKTFLYADLLIDEVQPDGSVQFWPWKFVITKLTLIFWRKRLKQWDSSKHWNFDIFKIYAFLWEKLWFFEKFLEVAFFCQKRVERYFVLEVSFQL